MDESQNKKRSTLFKVDLEILAQLNALRATSADDMTLDRPTLARNLFPRLVEISNSDNKDARSWALRALGAIGKFEPDEVIPILGGALKDPSTSVASAAAAALGEIGPEAASALPGLLELVEKGTADASVAWALWHIARRREAIPVLITELENVYEEELLFAFEALGEIGLEAREAGPALLALKARLQDVQDQWSYYGEALENTLRKIGAHH